MLASSEPLRAQTTHRLLTELEATWGHSMPGPVTATPDGDFLLVAEAGVLEVITTASLNAYEYPRLDPIGSVAVRAVDLMLDPEATLDTSFDELDIVYVAGGRLGLWGMQAHPTGREARAVRLDDAVDLADVGAQSSERWCNDLATIVINSETYLLAMFAEANSNRVRAYKLDDLRDAVDAGVSAEEEFGHELFANFDIAVDANSAFQPQTELPSFGLGMAVDGPRVYVALGQQGLVRIAFKLELNGTITVSVLPGPIFGDLSPYASQCNALYGDFEFTDGKDVTYTHAPYFMDVAIQPGPGSNRHLWAAVDHLGLVRFNVTNPNGWSSSIPITHQEGRAVNLSNGRRVIQLLDDPPPPSAPPGSVQRHYAHELRIVNNASGLAMAVSVSKDPFLSANGLRAEGRALDSLGEVLPNNAGGAPLEGHANYTLVYDLADIVAGVTCGSETYRLTAFVREGTRGLHLQQNVAAGNLVVYGGWATSKAKLPDETNADHTTFRAKFEDWPLAEDPPTVSRRLARHRPGRIPHDIGYSPTNRQVIYTGSNDDRLPPDGILVHCPNGITRFYDPETDGDDEDGTFGILWNPYSVWPKHGRDYVFGVGKPEPQTGEKPRWMLADVDPSSNLCGMNPAPPDRLKRVYFESPPDRFGSTGRGYYSGASVNLEYDMENDPDPLPVAFGSRVDTPDGVVVFDRSLLEAALEDSGNPDGSVLYPDAIGAVIGTLDTHPEFANIQDPQNETTLDHDFINEQGLGGLVQTYFPFLFELPELGEPLAPGHWMAAVPCMSVYLPDDLEVFDPMAFPEWLPDPVYITHFDHSMVRVFDVQNWEAISPMSILPDPITYTLIGPRAGTSAYRLETIVRSVEGVNRTFLFVIDFGGGIAVWDLTDLRGEGDGRVIAPADSDYADFFFEEWRSPEGAWDEFENNVWGMAIDQVQWNEGDVVRDEVYVYALVGRVGIEVLRFLPSNPAGQRLEWVRHIETPFGFGGLRIRQDLAGVRTLLVSEAQAGLRIFGYGN